MQDKNDNLMDKIVSLCKRRGFIFQSSEIYGGLVSAHDYGPLGIELKNNIKQLWWKKFVKERDDVVGIDTALIMNPKVWQASGHLQNFTDPLVDCKKCKKRFRADHILPPKSAKPSLDTMKDKPKNIKPVCPECGGEITGSRDFNLMFKTFMGPVEDEAAVVYFRPETAQGMFVDFKNILMATRKTLPFGVAQIGKAFRNEITPGNFIFRLREFELMEIEYFIKEEEWQKWFEHWREQMISWLKDLGINMKNIHEIEIPDGERAHYSKRTVDFEYNYPFGQKELYGLAYRTDFDLKNHEEFSGQNLKYKDPVTGEEFWPHVIEPTWGLDRSVLVVLLEAYSEEKDRVVLKIPAKLAPCKIAVFPLLANKPKLVETARNVYDNLRKEFMTMWDDRGNIGKRYYSQDEIGTPYCVTVDFETIEKDNSVTVRDRDTMKQERVKIDELISYFRRKLES